MVQRNQSMHIALPGCRVLGLTSRSIGLRITLRLVHSKAQWVVSACAQGFAEPVSEGRGWGKQMVLFLGFGPSFADLGVRPSGWHLD